MENWKFDQLPNCAAITLRSILFEGAPILHVVHDLEDHGWQFLGLDDADEKDIALVAMREIVELDPTVQEIAHIKPGCRAWRHSHESEWVIVET
jgi:hypothetical protein